MNLSQRKDMVIYLTLSTNTLRTFSFVNIVYVDMITLILSFVLFKLKPLQWGCLGE